MAKEMGYRVSAFHHAVESYKIADLLKQNDICSAVWADWYGFKMESYDGIPEHAALIHHQGACVVIHSADAHGIQRPNQEAAKAQAAGRRMGAQNPAAEVVRWSTTTPARDRGLEPLTGTAQPGNPGNV